MFVDLGDDENAVKMMDVQETQTSLSQKQSILKPIQINQIVNKIKLAILQEIYPFLHNLAKTMAVFSDAEEYQSREILDFPVNAYFQ